MFVYEVVHIAVMGEANTGPGTHLIFQQTEEDMIKVESCGVCLQIVKETYNMSKQLFLTSFSV
jgi:hypothetical protein